jgi:hypothetical protein
LAARKDQPRAALTRSDRKGSVPIRAPVASKMALPIAALRLQTVG